MKYPYTPFSTPLSGSAEETKLRLSSIFQWKKKRPPLVLLALVMVAAMGCGWLISCRQDTKVTPENLFDRYVDRFPEYTYTGEKRYDFDDSSLLMEDVPENVAEELVLNNYLFGMGRSEELISLAGSERLRLSAANELSGETEFERVILHSLSTVQTEEFTEEGPYFSTVEHPLESFLQDLCERINEYGLTEYSLIYADLTWKWTEASLELGPQLGDGRYQRFWLVGKTGKDDAWKLYEVYWWDVHATDPDKAEEYREESRAEDRESLVYQALLETDPRHEPLFLPNADLLAENEVAVTGMEFLGEAVLNETVGEVWEVSLAYPGGYESSQIVVLERSGYSDEYNGVFGVANFNAEGLTVTEIIQRVAYDMPDMEVALWRNGYPNPMGIGRWYDNQYHQDIGEEDAIEVLEGWEPIYAAGDHWARYSRRGVEALLYYHAAEEVHKYSAYTIDLTRDDFYTPRNIRVGSTRAEVLAAYPELCDTPYWHDTAPDFPGRDYLWYCANPDGWGAALLFFFENDVVTHIRLNNMFN